MSMHTQLIRGLLALPVAALLLIAAAIAPQASAPCETGTVDIQTPTLPRTVAFRTMLPGAINLVKRVKVSEG